jgi:small subunit ribosomal protein S2
MFPYIYAEQNNVHIIDLLQTSRFLAKARSFVSEAASEGQTFLFVGTKKGASTIVSQEAERCGASYVNSRWLGGLLTNWVTIKKRVARLKTLEQQELNGDFEKLSKKEVAMLRRQLKNLQSNLGGIKNMSKLPDVVVVVDQQTESIALQECAKLGIPTICIVDTDNDPDGITIPIPANGDSLTSLDLLLKTLSNAILESQQKIKSS